MSISVVKNNMYQSYSSCTILENHLSQLISILNSVDDSTAYIVSQYISTIDHSMGTVKRNFGRMLQVNKFELHILFSEFNNKTMDMIFKLNMLSSELNRLSIMAAVIYNLYILLESVELALESIGFSVEYFISVGILRGFIPIIVMVKNDLQVFKMLIDTNNRKLRVGVRR